MADSHFTGCLSPTVSSSGQSVPSSSTCSFRWWSLSSLDSHMYTPEASVTVLTSVVLSLPMGYYCVGVSPSCVCVCLDDMTGYWLCLPSPESWPHWSAVEPCITVGPPPVNHFSVSHSPHSTQTTSSTTPHTLHSATALSPYAHRTHALINHMEQTHSPTHLHTHTQTHTHTQQDWGVPHEFQLWNGLGN